KIFSPNGPARLPRYGSTLIMAFFRSPVAGSVGNHGSCEARMTSVFSTLHRAAASLSILAIAVLSLVPAEDLIRTDHDHRARRGVYDGAGATGSRAGNALRLRGELAIHLASANAEDGPPSSKASSARWREWRSA